MSDLYDLLAAEMQELDSRFRKASIEGRGTPQEVSDRRESVVKRLLEKYFPFPFRIAKGNVIDSYGQRSASIDCLVLNPDHPFTVSDDLFSLILADGVDFAIEVKPSLQSKSEIERSLHQIQTVKQLTKVRSGQIGGASSHCQKIPGIIFSNSAYADLELLANVIASYYEKHKIKRAHQFDIIVINNRSLLLNLRRGSYCEPASQSINDGLYAWETGDHTLAALLMFLNTMPLSAPRLTSSVLSSYLKGSDIQGQSRRFDAASNCLERIEVAQA